MNAVQPSGTPRWPGDPATLRVEDVDFEAIAHVLANTCCWRGRSLKFYSLAQHAVTVSVAAADLGGMGERERNELGLQALLADAPLAWTGVAVRQGTAAEGAKQAENRVRRTVREAAGLKPDLPGEWAEALTFSRRMAEASLHRDLPDAGRGGGVGSRGAGPLLPPLRGKTRPVAPDRAAKLWLERFAELKKGLSPQTGEPAREGGKAGVPDK